MSATVSRISIFAALMALVGGCAPAPTTPATADATAGGSPTAATTTPTEVTGSPTAPITPGEVIEAAPPAEGSPEWIIGQIMQIRLLPLPSLPGEQDTSSDDDSKPEGTSDEGIKTASAEEKSPADAEQLKQHLAQTRALRRERNLEVVKLSMNAIAKTAKDPAQEAVFLAAVHHLLDARLQLALQGDEESIAALYEVAEAFYEKKADSPAAAEAQLTVVNLAHANALKYAQSEPTWLKEFARHAQLHASRFPTDSERALPLLLAAGRSCELHGLSEEALSCYNLIQSKFPESPQSLQVAGILRRMKLKGQTIEFAGPTLDGNYLSIEDYKGKAVVIVFWATHATPFLTQVETLQKVTTKYKKYAQVLSVSLDSEESEIDAFLEKTQLTWPVIFHVEPDKRGWNNPLAAHYGISTLPTIWILDAQGVVSETDVTAKDFEDKLKTTILKYHKPESTKPATPASAGNP